MTAFPSYTPPPRKGFVLDPRTKILFMAFVTTLMFFIYENLLMDVAVALVPMALLVINKQLRTALVYGGLFALAIGAKLMQDRLALPDVLNIVVVLLIAMVIRLFPMFMLGYYLVESTTTDEFIAAMRKWHVPEAFIIPVSVVFRFVPTLAEESVSIAAAMRMRGISFASGGFWRTPTTFLEYRVVPLLISVVKIGDELSAAALSRGLGGLARRTTIARIGFGKWDALLFVIALGLTVWALADRGVIG